MQKTLLITRPMEDAEQLARDMHIIAPSCPILIAPVMKISPQTFELPDHKFDILILTSRHGVAAAKGRVDAPVICVGQATATAARQGGFIVNDVYANAEALIAELVFEKGQTALHIHGQYTQGDISKRLNLAGLETKSVGAYHQESAVWSPEMRDQIFAAKSLILPLFSPRSATLLSQRLVGYEGEMTLVALSDACLEAWSGPEFAMSCVAAEPLGAEMKNAIASQLA